MGNIYFYLFVRKTENDFSIHFSECWIGMMEKRKTERKCLLYLIRYDENDDIRSPHHRIIYYSLALTLLYTQHKYTS